MEDIDEEESTQLFCPLCAQKFGYSFGLVSMLESFKPSLYQRHDTQHNGIQHNGIQDNNK